MRRPLVAGNAKMNLDATTLGKVLEPLRAASQTAVAEAAYFPPFPLLGATRDLLNGSAVRWGGQNMHWEEKGAYTGEVSAAMLREFGCGLVLLGHSERRHGMGETDDMVARKARSARAAGLVPMVCIGETGEERDAGATEVVLTRQIVGSLQDLALDDAGDLVMAYEPVWAIGTGRVATPDQAQTAHRHVRAELETRFGAGLAAGIRVLYGGSVNAGNARELLALPDVDGALVGGASLAPDSFLPIVEAAN